MGAFTTVAPSQTVAMTLDRPAFAAELNAHYKNTASQNWSTFAITALQGATTHGFYNDGPDVLVYAPGYSTDSSAITTSWPYGDPFPADWGRIAWTRYMKYRLIQLPGGSATTAFGSLFTYVDVASLATQSTIEPGIGMVVNPKDQLRRRTHNDHPHWHHHHAHPLLGPAHTRHRRQVLRRRPHGHGAQRRDHAPDDRRVRDAAHSAHDPARRRLCGPDLRVRDRGARVEPRPRSNAIAADAARRPISHHDRNGDALRRASSLPAAFSSPEMQFFSEVISTTLRFFWSRVRGHSEHRIRALVTTSASTGSGPREPRANSGSRRATRHGIRADQPMALPADT